MPAENLFARPGLLRRIIILFYDSLLIFTLAMCCVALMIALRLAVEGPNAIADSGRAISGIWRLPTFLLILFVTCHFYVLFWLKSGQTLGMQTWRIKLLSSTNNGSITLKQAYVRLAVATLSLLCFGLGFLWILFNKDKLTWHDKLSNTYLVLLPRKK